MEDIAVELWMRIFSFACTDDGSTGRSLSLVSKFFQDVSRPYRLQSIVLKDREQLHDFAEILQRTPPEHRRIHHLFIADPHRPPRRTLAAFPDLSSLGKTELLRTLALYSLTSDEVQAIWQRLGPQAQSENAEILDRSIKQPVPELESILQFVAPTVRTLTAHASSCLYLLTNKFPELEELTILGPNVAIQRRPFPPGDLAQLPSLRRLHLVDSSEFFMQFVQRAPQITHLRLTGLSFLRQDAVDALGTALHIPPDHTDPASPSVVPHNYLPRIERIITDSQSVPTNASLIRRIRGVQGLTQNSKVTFIQPDSLEGTKPYVWSDARRDWLQRLEEKNGCWVIDPLKVDRVRLTRRSSSRS
ncbi:uncharacterized protein FIBRA_05387 [Fibroporia radiculosa]|uniref:F-box domain-containing protein n=1 Tax=Fibroporia radiculosa TaxID=599839 RepID=J4GQW9_9APHY|nr:uncharacterized protein FIBRA_05387 [Fibroporia radiculosa]CCM03260.1 predicted protein [Fibroporia radiculosa]